MYFAMLQPNNAQSSVVNQTELANEDQKFAVADILSSFATGEPSTPTTLAAFSAINSTTDLLTPTTLANLEQSFIQLQGNAVSHSANFPRESGFVPPVVDPIRATTSGVQMVKQEYSDYYNDDDSSQDTDSDNWMPPGKRRRYDDNGVMVQSYAQGSAGVMAPTNRRRRHKDDHLNPEDSEKRLVRRERNKVAAAKCRQRRVDLTNTLIVQSEGLEEEQSSLENEIQMLQQQKEQLEFLLEAHKPVCSAKGSANSSDCSSVVKAEKLDITYPSVLASADRVNVGTSTCPAGLTQSTSHCYTASSSFGSMLRPNTLPIPSSRKDMSSVTEATGVPITTPSSVFSFGLDSMMDGHTGLTPITGTPSCASQMHKNSTDGSTSSDNLSSPTTLMAL